jgi:GntR family transcriptional regulator
MGESDRSLRGIRRQSTMTTEIVPKYRQVYLTLKNDLDHGRYRRDKPFPSEIALAKKFGVSRVTLRHTMAMLQREGLIVRRPGVGTFPAQPDTRVKFRGTMDSFYETVRKASGRYVIKVLGCLRVSTPPFVRESCANFGESCLQVKRVSRNRVGKKPIHFSTHYFPSALIKNVLGKKLSSNALMLNLKKAGVKSFRTDLAITTTLADLEAARHLGVQAGTPLIVTKRISFDKAGEPIEFMYAMTRPDQYEYVFRFSAGDINHSAIRYE